MGVIKHQAIIVTAAYDRHEEGDSTHWAVVAHRKALEWIRPELVTPVSEPVVNNTRSFAILPDGSKEGWGASDEAHDSRDFFVEWMRNQAYEDGSSPLSWVEVYFGFVNEQKGVPGSGLIRSQDQDYERHQSKQSS